jgi:hypothetical protein
MGIPLWRLSANTAVYRAIIFGLIELSLASKYAQRHETSAG